MTTKKKTPPPGKVILVVDDSEQDQLLIKMAIERAGYEGSLARAHSVDSAIAHLTVHAANPPSLILLDIQMPMKDGFELLRWLRARTDDARRIPVAMLTTTNDRLEVLRAYDLGANSFLIKPTGFEDLCTMLADAGTYWLAHNRPPA